MVGGGGCGIWEAAAWFWEGERGLKMAARVQPEGLWDD